MNTIDTGSLDLKDYPLYKGWIDTSDDLKNNPQNTLKVLKTEGQEDGGEEFLGEELIIGAALGLAIARLSDEALSFILPVLDQPNVPQRLPTALDEANDVLKEAFSVGNTEKVVRDNLDSLISIGALTATGSLTYLDDFARRKSIVDGMVSISRYYTNNYFNNRVMPDIFKQVDKILSSPEGITQASWNPVREMLDKRLKSVPYWNIVANSAASRSYHYGVVKSGQLIGRRGYRIDAILDDRTSNICKELNGKEFWLADAVNLMERAVQAEDEDIKELHPWAKFEQVEGKSNRQLADSGIIMPPFHARCRTSITLL